ncbi:MAG: hypothetical protein FIA91_02815 [Geobacter sp.]|nr:hypothetical protein [Geobacter sp.]
MKKACLTLSFALLAAMPVSLYAAASCVDTDGEALIVNGDKPAAKIEAVARAKWAAIEQSVGVNVKAQSVVQNFALVDDAIMKQIKGVVTGHKVISEDISGDVYKVKVNACIEPANAGEALASLSLNNSIAVFLPATKPRERTHLEANDVQEEANILSETVIGALAEQGFTVVDVAPSGAADAAAIERAMKSGNFMTLRSMMYKFLSNLLLIGKADYTISTKKNEDIGFGTKMPFQNVTVRLTYRLVAKDPSSGKMIIVAAGTEEAKGLAKNAEDATAKGLKGVAEKLTPAILEKVSKHIKGIARKISVKVEGIADVSANFALKETLQNTSWVTNVEEKGLGDFIVSYPENPVYLANSVEQKGFKVTKFTPYQIELVQK